MKYAIAKQAELDALQFRASDHKYTLRGVVVPSVTQALDSLNPNGWWPSDKLEEARLRGTLVHKLTEIADQGGDWYEDAVETQLVDYIHAWEAFKQDFKVTILESEQRVYHTKYRYSGTFDRILKISLTSSPYVVDIKTGEEHSQYAIQLAAYVKAATEMQQSRYHLEHRAVVQLNNDATYKFIEYPTKDLNQDFEVFLAALTIHNWRARHG